MPELNTNSSNGGQKPPPQAGPPGGGGSPSRNPIIHDLLEAYKIQLDIWKMQNDNYFKRIQFVMIAIQVALFAGLVAVLGFEKLSPVQPITIMILAVLGVCSMIYVIKQNKKKMQYLEFSRRNLRNIEYKLIELEVPLGYFTGESIAFFKSGSKSLDIPKSDAIGKSKSNMHTVEFLMSKEMYPETDTCKKGIHEYSEVKGKMIGVDKFIAIVIYAVWVVVFIGAIFLLNYINNEQKKIVKADAEKPHATNTGVIDSETEIPKQANAISSQSAVNIHMPETIQVKNVSDESETALDFCRKNIPWIIAIAMVMVNIWISLRLVKSNERNIRKQINNAKEIALQEFKTTHITGNRINWIENLRNCVSELLGDCYLYYATYKITPDDFTKLRDYTEKIFHLQAKIALLLNMNKESQRKLGHSLEKFTNTIFMDVKEFKVENYKQARGETIAAARALFQEHWKKIKQLQ